MYAPHAPPASRKIREITPRPSPLPQAPTPLLPGQREAPRSASVTHLDPFSKPILERPEPPSPDMEPPVAAAIPEPAPMPSSALPFCAWLGLGLRLGLGLVTSLIRLGLGLGLGLAGY